jgi:hypothetical protein
MKNSIYNDFDDKKVHLTELFQLSITNSISDGKHSTSNFRIKKLCKETYNFIK